jgi:hypothetical protein
MPKTTKTRTKTRVNRATLYLLRSEDSLTARPMSVKLGYSTRPLKRRQEELSAAREKFNTQLLAIEVDQVQKREKLVKQLLREMAPAKWYYSNNSLEFLHHRAQPLVHQTLQSVSTLPVRQLGVELRAVQKRYAAAQALRASPMAEPGAKVVHVRTRSGKSPVPGTEALYFPRKQLVFYRDDFWTPQQYLQLLECGTHDALGRLWCFATETQPLTNLRGESC